MDRRFGWRFVKDESSGMVLQTFGVKWIHSLQLVGKNQMAVATVDGFV